MLLVIPLAVPFFSYLVVLCNGFCWRIWVVARTWSKARSQQFEQAEWTGRATLLEQPERKRPQNENGSGTTHSGQNDIGGHHLRQAGLVQDVAAFGDECVKRRALLHKAGTCNIRNERKAFSGNLRVGRFVHLPCTCHRLEWEDAFAKLPTDFPFCVVELQINHSGQILQKTLGPNCF